MLKATAPWQGPRGWGVAGAVQASKRQQNRPNESTAHKPDGS